MVYDEVLEEITTEDIPTSEFKPPSRSRLEYCRVFPVKTRSRSAVVAACRPSQDSGSSSYDDTNDGYDPDTPRRRQPRGSRLPPPSSPTVQKTQHSRSQGQSRQYCTQLCLLGLIRGGKLDRNCPNVLDHGTDHHRLNPTTLIRQLNQQLSPKKLQPDTKVGVRIAARTRHAWGRSSESRSGLTGIRSSAKSAPIELVNGLKSTSGVCIHALPQFKGRSCQSFLG
ncbi:hypothetical protein BO86DRAFT_214913 [Aspergillus japonicus CBS 114.51]|uniref:Uncharacterized protein n=1 Tax=Aspergillus japonicus CBS 114.51 TaxID=1448312 RepID=A0A8T8WQL5_ASPJA|nr:hypothetical protein BO86DRAFT_214913 [Aspergillus japonicus CBS 114.51]RAH77659.1 hypothetical protein BO86DRAFT_214913 [Aspergillus japonicus CBS 114.51]